MECARAAILAVLEPELAAVRGGTLEKDPKTRLQERLQAAGHPLPDYQTESVSGKAHRQTFLVRCVVRAFGLDTQGKGSSRRAAEQKAARLMLEALKNSTDVNR